MKPNLLGGKNSKRRLKRLNNTCLRCRFSKHLGEVFLFKLYIGAEDKVIGAVLTQETKGKEHVVTCINRRLIDAET